MSQDGGTNHLDWVYAPNGQMIGFKLNGTDNYYYLRNLQGDVTGIYDSDGEIVCRYTYSTWGYMQNIFDENGSIDYYSSHIGNLNPIRYRGYYFDRETDFYYLQSRYYSPEICRFINADALFVAGNVFTGSNMFAYCLNNPVMLCDPSGLAPVSLREQLLTAIFGFLGAIAVANDCREVTGTSVRLKSTEKLADELWQFEYNFFRWGEVNYTAKIIIGTKKGWLDYAKSNIHEVTESSWFADVADAISEIAKDELQIEDFDPIYEEEDSSLPWRGWALIWAAASFVAAIATHAHKKEIDRYFYFKQLYSFVNESYGNVPIYQITKFNDKQKIFDAYAQEYPHAMRFI